MEMTVIRPGVLTTVQDRGRPGHRGIGVPLSGAMDVFALRVANLLVGNREDAATLEITLIGPDVEFSEDAWVAVGGAEFSGIPAWRPWLVRAGERLKFGPCQRGCRGYLAIAGGVEVAPVLGSRSTYLRGSMGGFQGRSLQSGDRLAIASQEGRALAAHPGGFFVSPSLLPLYSPSPVIRVMRGAQADDYGAALGASDFTVLSQSDRMGLRLAGPALKRNSSEELISTAVVPGTVQVPPDGQPIVLMADAQTIGGYPQVAHVASVDLPLVAQLRPGDSLRFRDVTVEEAQRLLLNRERELAMLREGLEAKQNAG